MVGSGIPALGLFLLMQGSVGEGADERGQRAEQRPSSPSIQPPNTALFFHRWEWNPGILLSME